MWARVAAPPLAPSVLPARGTRQATQPRFATASRVQLWFHRRPKHLRVRGCVRVAADGSSGGGGETQQVRSESTSQAMLRFLLGSERSPQPSNSYGSYGGTGAGARVAGTAAAGDSAAHEVLRAALIDGGEGSAGGGEQGAEPVLLRTLSLCWQPLSERVGEDGQTLAERALSVAIVLKQLGMSADALALCFLREAVIVGAVRGGLAPVPSIHTEAPAFAHLRLRLPVC